MFETRQINPAFKVVCTEQHTKPSKDITEQVDLIWQEETNTNPLFNGTILSVQSVEEQQLSTCLSEYKYFLAQHKKANLYQSLRIQALAVSGLLECKDGIVFGKRSEEVTQDASLFELAPSGSVQASLLVGRYVDYQQQLLLELQEECGLQTSDIELIKPFLLIEDCKNHVFDIAIYLRSTLDAAQILDCFAKSESQEYSTLEIVPADQITSFIDKQSIAPISLELLAQKTL